MTAQELERKAWRLIAAAKVAHDRNRRRLLMQEAFDLVRRVSTLRQPETGEIENVPPFADGYQLRLSNAEGRTLWIDLSVESRADAVWAAYALATGCAEEYEDFDLWDGSDHLLNHQIASILSDTPQEVSLATQLAVIEREETLLQSHAKLAKSRKLLEETAALRYQLTTRESA